MVCGKERYPAGAFRQGGERIPAWMAIAIPHNSDGVKDWPVLLLQAVGSFP